MLRTLKISLAVAALLVLSHSALAAGECQDLSGRYLLGSKVQGGSGFSSRGQYDVALIITQDGCKSVHMVWYTGTTKGAEYFAVTDGQARPTGENTMTTWIWHNGKVLEQIQETKVSPTDDEVLDGLYELDDQKNLDLTAGLIENGSPIDAESSIYVRTR